MGVFLVTAIGAALVVGLGLWSVRTAKRESEAEKRSLGRFRTLDSATKSPKKEEPERNASSNATSALSGTTGPPLRP
jgi:hypothetical protein